MDRYYGPLEESEDPRAGVGWKPDPRSVATNGDPVGLSSKRVEELERGHGRK
jgi:hypothetical protein